jgi:Tfp pilus assembly protein PilF
MVPARIALGRAYIAKRQVDEALAELQKALAAEPNAAEAHFQVGVIQQDLKRSPTAAIAAFEKAVSLDPGNAEYAIRLGVALSAEKQGAKAVAVLGKNVQGPAAARPDAWTYLAGAHLVAVQYDDAIRAGLKALALLDGSPETSLSRGIRGMACDYLAWAYINRKDRENAIKYGAQARSLGFKDPDLFKRVSDLEGGMQFKEDAVKPPPAKRRPTGTRTRR